MAGLTDIIAQQGFESAKQQPDVGGSFIKGAELALHAESVQQQAQHLQIQQQQLQQAKMQNFMESVSKIHDFKDAASRKGYLKFLQGQNQQLNLGIPPDSLEFALASPENTARVGTLQSMVEDGSLTGQQAIAIAMNPKQLSSIVPKDKYAGMKDLENIDTGSLDVQDLSDKVAKAYAQRQSNNAQMLRASSYTDNAQTRKDEQAAQAVRHITDDKVIVPLQTQSQNIAKGMDLLNGTPSYKRLAEVAQDFSAALSNKSVSSDYKLRQIDTPTLKQKIADAVAFSQSNPDQPADPIIVKFWRDMGESLNGAFDRQIAARANVLSSQLDTIYSKNPNAKAAAKNIAKSYKTGEWKGPGGELSQSVRGLSLSSWADRIKSKPALKDAALKELSTETGRSVDELKQLMGL